MFLRVMLFEFFNIFGGDYIYSFMDAGVED